MEDVNEVRAFVDAVVNQDRRMHKLTDIGTACHWAANVGKVLKKIYVIEKGGAEAFRRGRKVDPRIMEDFLEVG